MDIFYNTNDLSLQQKRELCSDCKEICYTWQVDILNCSEYSSRRQIDMAFEAIMSKLNDSTHFVVVDRKLADLNGIKHFEVAFRTMEDIEYFLWIRVENKHMDAIIKKYDLQPK